MDAVTLLIVYSIVYRVLIIVAGIVAMVLGYRLFERGVFSSGSTSISGKAREVTFSVKNAAPGTCFALFGCVIIVVMLFQGPTFAVPEKSTGSSSTGSAKSVTSAHESPPVPNNPPRDPYVIR